eukprot:1137628-Pelagomonas_calceolata.AAC.3
MAKGNEKRVKLIQRYRSVVEKELDEVCGEILGLLDEHLVPSASTVEASVFYLKMKADYHRYLAEFKVGWFTVRSMYECQRHAQECHDAHISVSTQNPSPRRTLASSPCLRSFADGGGPQERRGQDAGGL